MLYRSLFKRPINFVIAFIVLSPVFLLINLFLFIANHVHPFFIQRRPGKNEKIFRIIKLKTMNDKRDKESNLLPDARRLKAFKSAIRLNKALGLSYFKVSNGKM